LASKLNQQEIHMQDRRNHILKDGVCNCNNKWLVLIIEHGKEQICHQ
jgi:hypothetical protein